MNDLATIQRQWKVDEGTARRLKEAAESEVPEKDEALQAVAEALGQTILMVATFGDELYEKTTGKHPGETVAVACAMMYSLGYQRGKKEMAMQNILGGETCRE